MACASAWSTEIPEEGAASVTVGGGLYTDRRAFLWDRVPNSALWCFVLGTRLEASSTMAVHPLLAGRTCYHAFEIEPGLYTPGTFLNVKPAACLDEIGISRQLSGLRVLDVGAWDGAFTFELARRGADVTA